VLSGIGATGLFGGVNLNSSFIKNHSLYRFELAFLSV
jgi:hypothetical protein